MHLTFLLFFISASSAVSVFPVGLTPPRPDGVFPQPHRAVLQLSAAEAQLPPHLTNRQYKDPRVRDALARTSWFGPGEQPVYDREADKINRREIYSVLNHAGLVRSNRV